MAKWKVTAQYRWQDPDNPPALVSATRPMVWASEADDLRVVESVVRVLQDADGEDSPIGRSVATEIRIERVP
jgi:hypothetical protein